MTVQKMMLLLSALPPEMELVLDIGDDTFITVCEERSTVISLPIEMDESQEDGFLYEDCFLVVPCRCAEVDLPVIPQPPNFN